MEFLKRLKARHWAWIHFKFVIGILWPVFMITSPPDLIQNEVNPVIMTVAMTLSLIGTIVSMVGYMFCLQAGKLGVIGVSVELSGLILAVLGPAAYLLTRVAMLVGPNSIGMSSGLLFAYALCAVYLYRFVIIIPRFRFEAHDPSKED